MIDVKYKVAPSMLNSFKNFLDGKWENKLSMLQKLNRIKGPTSKYMDKGNDLEACVKDKVYFSGNNSYPNKIVDQMHEITKGGIWQQFVEAPIMTKKGPVLLYGYIDCIVENIAIDVKWKLRYTGRAFFDSMQHPTYLYCARDQGIEVDRFKYLITDEKEVYHEDYNVGSMSDVIYICEQIIEFAEENKDNIINPKFFGGE